MSDALVYFDGRLMPAGEVGISPFDRGLTLGDGLFETVRAYEGRIFRLREHMARLEHGAGVIGLDLPSRLAEALEELLAANGWPTAVLRLTVTRGAAAPARGGLLPDPDIRPTVLITGRDLAGQPPYPARFYEQGMRLATCGPARDERSPLSGCKTLNYLPQLLVRREAARLGCDEGLQLNGAGQVVGASVANLFLVLDGALVTPALETGPLPGVTRSAVLDLARQLGIPAEERIVLPAELPAASEAFLTNTLLEIAPVLSMDGHLLPRVPGEVTAALARLWAERLMESE